MSTETNIRNRPVPTPIQVAAAARQRRLAREAAGRIEAAAETLPSKREVSTAGGEARLVVNPRSLADWRQWLHKLGASDARGTSVGTAMIVRCRVDGVRLQLVGYGVPALYQARTAEAQRRTAVRP
ncbi:hypothetical protein Q3A86_33330 [Streptomyces sp. NBUA17]|uniref:hypothetical protein n=1 Tax=Streptomyces sp. NBUA17 TaxID=3062275 RepID=UPI0037D9D5DB